MEMIASPTYKITKKNIKQIAHIMKGAVKRTIAILPCLNLLIVSYCVLSGK